MNTAYTLSLIRKRFRNLTEVGADLFRAERRNNGSIIGVFYFDFGQPLKKATFNLNDYLQQVLATDFYKHEGSLQWNYYLYFVVETSLFNRVWKDGRAANIEADRVFARKYVKSEELLDKELTEPLAERVGAVHPPKDIAAAWTNALTDGGLGKICDSSAPYTRVVEEFLSGKIEGGYEFNTAALTPAEPGRPIHKLNIKRFRDHPLTKYYEFARVNLFRGANGTGKTSLLEAIELSICGGILRQDGDQPSGAHIDVTFDGTDQAERCPKSGSALYRARDLAWYGQYYPTKNRLCQNFGRFNFFDSDAAFKLSQAKTTEEITKAIGTLFLGEQATTLEERMLACSERFETEERQLSKRLSALRKQNVKWKSELKELSRIVDTRETLLSQVQSKASESHWKKLPAKLDLNRLVLLKESVDDLLSELAETSRQIDWLATLSVRSLNGESKKLTQALGDIKALQSSVGALAERIADTKEKISKLETETRILDRLQAYHDADAFSVVGLSVEIGQARARLTQRKKATDLFGRIDTESFRQVEISFVEYRKTRQDEIRRQRTAISRKRSTFGNLQASIGQTRALIEQIKGLGHRYCELNPETSDCPLCGAHYEMMRLLDRIGPLKSQSNIDSGLRELAAEIARDEKTLSEVEKVSERLERLGEAASLVLTKKELESGSLASIVSKLSSVTGQRSDDQAKLEDLTLTQSRLSRLGFSESELSNLWARAINECGLPEASLHKSSTVVRESAKRRKSIADLNKMLLDFDKENKRNDRQVGHIQKECLGDEDVHDPVVELERRLAFVNEALADTTRIERNVSLHVTDDFTQIKRRLTTFSETLERVQRALKQVEEKDLLEKRLGTNLKENEQEITTLEPPQQRAKQAIDLISGLLKSENKEQHLAGTIKDHRERLSALFCKIHAPNEFEGVELNGQLSLRRSTGTSSSVFEISTGQRAALALSIFLAMNSSVSNRAPWLIFDDPVAHVDDLNILSFFDTLRDLLLLGNQQIFFATANSRIADLFVRKFDFLGSEGLKQFPLDRPN
jgi:DNA repair exonuclease SbcCD ATPase subunit